MKTIYICDLCGKQFNDWEECWDHEKNHITPEAYSVKPVSYISDNGEPVTYPMDINVPMTDGALIQYIFYKIVTPASQPVPEPGPEKEAANE